jgi:hypothetical protein
MTHLENRISHALTTAPATPSPDLFERVLDSIDADRRRRRRALLTASAAGAVTALAAIAVLALTPRTNGALAMSWWILEVTTTLVLVAIAVWLGPFIKRFGRAYAADVFHDNPLTGKSYIVLTDIVYYLIFAAYILMTAHFTPSEEWNAGVTGGVGGEQLGAAALRVGGILLVIGALHGLNIVLMPVLGRLFSLNRKLSAEQRDPDPLGYR